MGTCSAAGFASNEKPFVLGLNLPTQSLFFSSQPAGLPTKIPSNSKKLAHHQRLVKVMRWRNKSHLLSHAN
jgi:hypothetical protein